MTALVVLLVLSSADPCAGTFDRTDTCVAPKAVDLAHAPGDVQVEPDTVLPEAGPAVDPLLVPQTLAFAAALSSVLGVGAVFAAYFVNDKPPFAIDGGSWRVASEVTGGSLLGLSGLLTAASAASWVFDPSTGKMRVEIAGGD